MALEMDDTDLKKYLETKVSKAAWDSYFDKNEMLIYLNHISIKEPMQYLSVLGL